MSIIWIFTPIGLISVFINSYYCLSTVKMELTVNMNYMTLSCFVTERNSLKNIYLFCPLMSNQLNCRENCKKQCQDEQCRADSLIQCQDIGFSSDSKVYQINYIIDGSISDNHGNWLCQYGGVSSSAIYVNASSPKTEVQKTTKKSLPGIDINTEFREVTTSIRSKRPSTIVTDAAIEYIQIDKLLTKSEFIITVIGLLALSLIFNLVFCSRMIIIHCHSKKKPQDNSQTFPLNPTNPTYNQSISLASSDLERIYEDTPLNYRLMPLFTQLKSGNGTYLPPGTLSPPPGITSTLPQLPYSPSMSFVSTPVDTDTYQPTYPFIPDHRQSNFGTLNYSNDNSSNYTNFVSVQPDGSTLPQPMYLAFPAPVAGAAHTMTIAGNRYMPYGNPALQTNATMPKENRFTSKRPDTSSSSNGPKSNNSNNSTTHEDGKSNYERSREMMEEADNLLRTADTLLKSTETEMIFYQQ